jgi:hypothetical protein
VVVELTVNKQEPAHLDKWLARWVFADDAVRLAMKRNTQDGGPSRDRSWRNRGKKFSARIRNECERCRGCLTDQRPAYRAYSDIPSLIVCATCAVEALKLGLAVEVLGGVKGKAA